MARRATLTSVPLGEASPPPLDGIFDAPSAPHFTDGEKRYVEKVKELEARFSKKGRPRKTKKAKRIAKKKRGRDRVLKRRAFDPSSVIKGHGGVQVKKNTTLKSLLRGVWWIGKPLLSLLNKRVRLVNDQFLNKRTTLLSLVRSMPLAKKPLVDLFVNKML